MFDEFPLPVCSLAVFSDVFDSICVIHVAPYKMIWLWSLSHAIKAARGYPHTRPHIIFSLGPVPLESRFATVRGATGSTSRQRGQFLKTIGGSTFSSSEKSIFFLLFACVISSYMRFFISSLRIS